MEGKTLNLRGRSQSPRGGRTFAALRALLRLVGAVLEQQNDEWAVGRRYFSQESMNKLTEPSQEEVVQALLELQTA